MDLRRTRRAKLDGLIMVLSTLAALSAVSVARATGAEPLFALPIVGPPAGAHGVACRDPGVPEPARQPAIPPPCEDPTAGPEDRLPDAEVERSNGLIAAAWLAAPTRRYDHGVLGDAVEAGAVAVRLRDGSVLTYSLPPDAVFEDRRARIVDADGDGAPEVLVVRSGLRTGGGLMLLAVREGHLRPVAVSEPIGRAHRWLNPAGVADFDGDGRPEVAAVVTPHIGGTLTLYEWRGDRLVPEHRAEGFSNHAIGTRELTLAAVLDANGDGVPDLALPSADRRALRIVSFAGGRLRELQRVPHEHAITGPLVAADANGDGVVDVRYALSGGRPVTLLHR